ncbi:DUF1684 domain-containing protein [Luteimonas sp. MJ204]|uniref:DUF1684 domain-containing protein n=1 Tax=Luteimonas sp. MJ145 TaxID=3129234 RepID=UPI0031BB3628
MTRHLSPAAFAACILFAAALAGCGSDAPPAGGDHQATGVARTSPALTAAEAEWRSERREGLLAEDGWTSLVGLHRLELRAHYVGNSATSGIRLGHGPEKLGLVQQEGGRVYFTAEKGVDVAVGDAPVTGRIELHDALDPEPTELLFDDGKGRLSLITRGGQHALRVKHAEASGRTGFGELEYWPVDADWLVEARFEPHPAGRTIEIANIVGGIDQLPNPGAVEFSRGGVDYRLEAIDGEDGGLFLILADRTNGHASYGAGRYLDTAPPDADGRVILNFNRAYNPPCAFTDFATCPLPPPENRLELAVTAGEKAYAKPGSTPRQAGDQAAAADAGTGA